MQDWNNAYKQNGVIQKPVLDLVKKAVSLFKKKKIKAILDLGFGTGRHTVYLAKNGFKVYGIDISKEGKKITLERLKKSNLKAKLKISSMSGLPYPDKFFDAVVSTYVVHHAVKRDILKTFSEINRILKKSGFLVLTVPTPKDGNFGHGKKLEPNTFLGVPDLDHDTPHHFFTKKELKQILHNYRFIHFKQIIWFSERRKCKASSWEIIAEKLV